MMKKEFALLALAALCSMALANMPPAITGLNGPSALRALDAGIWYIYADDPEGEQVWFQMDWGDDSGSAGTMNYFSHTYANPGTYYITALASDPGGALSQNTTQVQVLPAPPPLCPGYALLNFSNNMSAGNYAIMLDGTYLIGTDQLASYRLYHGPNQIALITNASWNSSRTFAAANGDLLLIETCMSAVGHSYGSIWSYVNFSIAGYQGNQSQPSAPAPYSCENDTGYIKLLPGQSIEIGNASVAYSHTGSWQSSLYAQLSVSHRVAHESWSVPVDVNDSSSFFFSNGGSMHVSVCDAAFPHFVNSQWARVKAIYKPGIGETAPTSYLSLKKGSNTVILPANYTLSMEKVAPLCDSPSVAKVYNFAWARFEISGMLKPGKAYIIEAGKDCEIPLYGDLLPASYIASVDLPPPEQEEPGPNATEQPVANQTSQVLQCIDGTREGECSSDKPLLCVNGTLIDSAGRCGCPEGKMALGGSCADAIVPEP
ncbi:MAG: PKD domain-containing protein, partial [Candidatus Micrarchaeia archaeon]